MLNDDIRNTADGIQSFIGKVIKNTVRGFITFAFFCIVVSALSYAIPAALAAGGFSAGVSAFFNAILCAPWWSEMARPLFLPAAFLGAAIMGGSSLIPGSHELGKFFGSSERERNSPEREAGRAQQMENYAYKEGHGSRMARAGYERDYAAVTR
jgi:hypothetical protein